MLEIIFAIVVIYLLIVFILSRFVVPYLGFKDKQLPDKIPEDMQKAIEELKNKANSKNEFLELTYDFIGDKYKTGRLNVILRFNYLFKPVEKIWQASGFMPCTQNNFLMRIFLIKSGFFKENEVKRKHSFFNFNIHQYLQVNLGGKWIDIDVGEKQRGMPIGRHLKYFGL